MKFVDAFELGIRDIKKHKMRFCLNIMSIAIILLVIAGLMSFVLTLNATVKEDMKQHLIKNGNSITVFLNGAHNDKGNYGVTWEESQLMKEFITDYDGNVGIRESVWHNEVEIIVAQEVRNVDVCYFGENSEYTGDSTPRLIEGIDWEGESDETKYIWLGLDTYDLIRKVNPDFKIGDKLHFVVAGKTNVALETAGLIDGNAFYVTRKNAIKNCFVSVSCIYYDLTLQDGNDPVTSLRQLQKSLDVIDKDLIKDEQQNERINCNEFSQLYGFNYILLPYQIIVALVILFFTNLILGVLKNNAVINVFDNIKTFSLLRCIGLENKKIVAISIVETLLCLCISVILGGILSFAFKNVISSVANQVIGEKLYDLHTTAYDSAWWVMLCYFVAISLLAVLYFSLTLIKYLKRKNLLGTLKRE